MDLPRFRVPSAIDEVFYIPEFVSVDEERYLMRKMAESSNVKWKTLPNRRLQIWGGELTPMNTLIPQELPPFITEYPNVIQRLRNTGVFDLSKHREPNHIIVNEYGPGQGIMPHEDGPSYHPVVATLSLGSHTVFNYHRYVTEREPSLEHISLSPGSSTSTPSSIPANSQVSAGRAIDPTPILSLLLEPRSLVITTKELYTQHLHAIEPLQRDVLAPQNTLLYSSTNQHAADDPYDVYGTRHPEPAPIRVANWELLSEDSEMGRAAREGGVLDRKTRVSLTFRDVEKVVGGKGLGRLFSSKR